MRAALEPGLWRIGGYRVEADPADFLGVTYRDPDGTPLYCYHAERRACSGRGGGQSRPPSRSRRVRRCRDGRSRSDPLGRAGPVRGGLLDAAGGVSAGSFASLNLGLKTADEPGNVAENRRRLCAEVGAEPEWLAMNRQRHTAVVHRAMPGARRPGDGVWTDEPGMPCSR